MLGLGLICLCLLLLFLGLLLGRCDGGATLWAGRRITRRLGRGHTGAAVEVEQHGVGDRREVVALEPRRLLELVTTQSSSASESPERVATTPFIPASANADCASEYFCPA